MMKSFKTMLLTGSVIALTFSAAIAGEGFKLTSSSFADNDIMQSKYAAKGGPRKCDGENVSPALSWENAPANTKSFAIVAHDQVGRHGLGVDHWVLYDIPADVTGFAEGETPAGSRAGPNITGKQAYLGPCPDVGDMPHHYEFVIMALDLDVGTLPDGLGLADFMTAVADHSIGATSMVGRYARN